MKLGNNFDLVEISSVDAAKEITKNEKNLTVNGHGLQNLIRKQLVSAGGKKTAVGKPPLNNLTMD